MAYEKWAPGMVHGESDYVAGWYWVTDVSQSEVKCSSSEREYLVFGHFGHEFERTKIPPYQFPFSFDLDLMLRTYTWDWIWNHRIIKYTCYGESGEPCGTNVFDTKAKNSGLH